MATRDSKGRFVKGNDNGWKGKKRDVPWLKKYNFKKGQEGYWKDKKRDVPWLKKYAPKEGETNSGSFKKGQKSWNKIDGLALKRKRNRKEMIINWCQANNTYRVPPHCMIHHINQNQLDNRPENLQLMDKRFHNQLHTEFFKSENKVIQYVKTR